MKVESELSMNLEFPDGKYLCIIMRSCSQTTENHYSFSFSKFHLGILIRCTKSWDLVPLFGNIISIAWAICLHHIFSKYNQMVQDKMVSIITLAGLTESIGTQLHKIPQL